MAIMSLNTLRFKGYKFNCQAHERSPPSLVQLPGSGMILQELPASYAADLDRYSSSTRRSSSAVDSGVLSPDALSPGEFGGNWD